LKTDIEIAQSCEIKPIGEIAAVAGVDEKYLELYGRYKAKVDYALLKESDRSNGKLILVTAINPTPAGEGKTTTTVGLADAMRKIGKNTLVALREPSLGPVFGVKGGAAGGGWAQVVPMEDINLHFTGDFHAIGAANNLLAAMLDNHIQQGNGLGIDVKKITWKRCVDMNDRQLRNIVNGLGGRMQGVPREDGFDITVASEIMAVLCLAADIPDLKARLGRMVVAYTYDGKPVTAHDLKAEGAMAALLKDALKPNLVQTLEGTPAFIHGGPFANIAHGCNSVMATKMAMKLADYTVTEAGFGEIWVQKSSLISSAVLPALNPLLLLLLPPFEHSKTTAVFPRQSSTQKISKLLKKVCLIFCSMLTISKMSSISPALSPLMPSPLTHQPNLSLLKISAASLALMLLSPKYGQRAEKAVKLLPKKLSVYANNPTISASAMTLKIALKRSSMILPQKFIMQTALSLPLALKSRPRNLRLWALTSSPFAWQRLSIPSLTMRKSLALPRTSLLLSEISRFLPAQASLLPSPVIL